jgi:lipid-A-disaccharide synthase
MIIAKESLLQHTKSAGLPEDLQVQIGGLPGALAQADVAIASTGTVTLECAYFGVPTVALYKASWPTYQLGKRIIKVKYLAMPNLLANEEVFPEFIQNAATAENIARAALELLRDDARRVRIKAGLAEIVASLGGPGASRRAAHAILNL